MTDLKVAITGGTSGLGLALVREFRRRGARVPFVARTAHTVAAVAQMHGAHGILGDVARKEDIHPIALQITAALGGLDVLVNNASSLGPTPLALLADTACEDLERALATNVLGPFRLTKALLGALSAAARDGRGAVVLNVCSDAALTPYPRWGAYGASKAALPRPCRPACRACMWRAAPPSKSASPAVHRSPPMTSPASPPSSSAPATFTRVPRTARCRRRWLPVIVSRSGRSPPRSRRCSAI